MTWKDAVLVGRPEGNNADNANKGGLVILIQDGPSGRQEEVGRIAFDRTEGAQKDKQLREATDEVVDTARKTIDTIKSLFEQTGTLQ